MAGCVSICLLQNTPLWSHTPFVKWLSTFTPFLVVVYFVKKLSWTCVIFFCNKYLRIGSHFGGGANWMHRNQRHIAHLHQIGKTFLRKYIHVLSRTHTHKYTNTSQLPYLLRRYDNHTHDKHTNWNRQKRALTITRTYKYMHTKAHEHSTNKPSQQRLCHVCSLVCA